MMDISKFFRKNIAALVPYSTARDEFDGALDVYLDANENPNDNGFNRYPDPHHRLLKRSISEIKGVPTESIFVGNGSDEPIDLLYRVFCEPGVSNAVMIAPTYGMYRVAAEINDVELREVPLDDNFRLDAEKLLAATDENTRLIFLCSPNNPSGNALDAKMIERVVEGFNGIVVLDEAYIDFCPDRSFLPNLGRYPNLVILQTLSKAWGLAGLRIGMAFASELIISTMSRVKYPYNINVPTQKTVVNALAERAKMEAQVAEIIAERAKLERVLSGSKNVKRLYQSDANFLLIKVDTPRELYNFLIRCGILVRDRSRISGCEGCLRITVGTPAENQRLIEVFALLDAGVPQDDIAVRYCQSATTTAERRATISRKTRETDISMTVDLDGGGVSEISTGLAFFDHMLEQIPHHSGIGLTIKAVGDTHVDEHHTIEDVGIVLGEALRAALGDKRGVERYGFSLPMDESSATVLIDFGGRIMLVWEAEFVRERIGDVPTEMFQHFFRSVADAAACNLHVQCDGENEHHKIEAIFKAFAKAIKMAVRKDQFVYTMPSSKGKL